MYLQFGGPWDGTAVPEILSRPTKSAVVEFPPTYQKSAWGSHFLCDTKSNVSPFDAYRTPPIYQTPPVLQQFVVIPTAAGQAVVPFIPVTGLPLPYVPIPHAYPPVNGMIPTIGPHQPFHPCSSFLPDQPLTVEPAHVEPKSAVSENETLPNLADISSKSCNKDTETNTGVESEPHDQCELQETPLLSGSEARKPKPALWSQLFGSSSNAATGSHSEHKTKELKSESDRDPITLSIYNALQRYKYHAAPKTLNIIPRGLNNFGNLCYMNSALQVLVHLPAFSHLMSWLPSRKPEEKPSSTPILDAVKHFCSQFYLVRDNTVGSHKTPRRLGFHIGDPLTTHALTRSLMTHQRFAQGHQEDVEEFLSFLLDSLHEELVAIRKEHEPISNDVAPKKDDNEEEDDDWVSMGQRNRERIATDIGKTESLITQIFGGKYGSEIKKKNAKNSCTIQPFFTVQLDIQSDEVQTISDALRSSFGKEVVHQNESPDIQRIVYFEELPDTLILQLKVFVFDAQKSCASKLQKLINFEESLEIPSSCFLNRLNSSRRYKLFAAIYHHGSDVNKGHYSAAVFHTGQRIWLSFSDATVEKTDLPSVLKPDESSNKTPYLLFYRKLDSFGQS